MNKINDYTYILGFFLAIAFGTQAYASEPTSDNCVTGKNIITSKKSECLEKKRIDTNIKIVDKKNTPKNSLSLEKEPKKYLSSPAAKTAKEYREKTRGKKQQLQQNSGAGQAADTTCDGVSSCNDMISTCIALGGNVTQTSYEPGTGAPNGATCYAP